MQLLSGLMLVMCATCVNAEHIDHLGGFVGGAFGATKFVGEFDSSPYFSDVDEKAGTINVYGGYNFNRYFGLEGTILISGDLSTGSNYDASYDEITITPKLTVPISERFAFYFKAGVSLASYSEVYDLVPAFADDEYFWGGVGLTAGLGVQIAVMQYLHLRISYDHSSIEFKPTEDTAFDGTFVFVVPDLDADINRTSIGMHYQF
jgi:opacity protein-like surface antigen